MTTVGWRLLSPAFICLDCSWSVFRSFFTSLFLSFGFALARPARCWFCYTSIAALRYINNQFLCRMSLLCLSLAANLRCAGVSRTESIGILAPPAVEAVVSLFLIRTVWRNGRKRWLLVAEAWFFFILSIVDFASRDVVRNTSSLDAFEPIDKAVGVMSFGPILLYMSFLFLLTRADLLPLISPASLRTTFQFAIFSFIPPVVMSNELGSLLGVSYRLGPSSVPEIGFLNPTSRSLSSAFTLTTVVLLATFQLLIFLLCTWRISQAWAGISSSEPVFVSATRARRDSTTSDSYLGDERGIRGLSWLALALALGATETFLALGSQTFALVLVRRILRVFSRGFLMYSLVRGSSDGFSNLEEGQPEMSKGGGIRALISNPRFSTFAQLTPNATSFHNLQRAGRPANANPFVDPGRNMTPDSRVTVLYDQKSAPVLQMRFSGLDVPDSSKFTTRSIRSSSNATQPTSLAGHGSHATSTPARSRSRTLSEKRAGPPLASIHIPEQAILAGVIPIQSASSNRSSMPPVPPLPQPGPSKLSLGSVNRSNSLSTSGEGTLESAPDLAPPFPALPPRAVVRRPTQLAYAVEEEDEPASSQHRSRSQSTSRSHLRTDTADSNISAFSTASRRKPVPAHTPGGTVIDLPSTNQERRPSVPQSNSGEQVVVETHSALFPDEQAQDYYASSAQSSVRSSSTSELTSTYTPSPAEILTGRPSRLAERVAQLERQQRLSGQEEHTWMRGREVPIPMPMSQNTVVSRTPEVLTTGADFESSRVELEGIASPKSAWSAKAPWPTSTPASTSRPALGLPANPRAARPGSNVEGWGRKLSDAGSIPTLRALATEEQERGRDNSRWKESEALGRYEGDLVRRSLVENASRRGSTSSNPFVGDEPHAM